jgi:hypothetical protein
MSAGEYSNQLRKEEPSYKGNEITKCCKDFFHTTSFPQKNGEFSNLAGSF